MEYAKDIIYNLKYDKLVNKNQSRTSRLIQKIKKNKLIILSITLLMGLIIFDYFLIKSFRNLLMVLWCMFVFEVCPRSDKLSQKGTSPRWQKE